MARITALTSGLVMALVGTFVLPADWSAGRGESDHETMKYNPLTADEERVIVEASQTDMIQAFKDWGFKPIPCSFLHYAFFGGSFHCSTLDVRRRGTLQSYF